MNISHHSTVSNDTCVTKNENQTNYLSKLNVYGNECSIAGKSTIRIIKHCCQLEQRFNEFCLLRSLLQQLLYFHSNDNTQYEREQYLLRLFDTNKPDDMYLKGNLFLLNDLLGVGFLRYSIQGENTNEKNFVRTYETDMNELLLHILNQLIESPAIMNETSTTMRPMSR